MLKDMSLYFGKRKQGSILIGLIETAWAIYEKKIKWHRIFSRRS